MNRKINMKYINKGVIFFAFLALIMAAMIYASPKTHNDIVAMPEKSIRTSAQVEKITPNTNIIYRYYYEKDEKTIEENKKPEYYMINMTEDTLKNKMEDWIVEEFSGKKVILKKSIKGKSPYYFVIGEKDGFIAAFYKNGIDDLRLRELTDTSINRLPKEEQEKIKKGIVVYGEEEMIKILEDYSS